MLVDTFLKLIEKVIDLVKLEKLTKEQFFEKIITPLFNELQLVVDDYFKLFFKARDLVNSNSEKDFKYSVEEIKKAREHLLIHRIKVREMAESLQVYYNDKRLNGFANNIQKFFFSTNVDSEEQMKSSKALKLVELCSYIMQEDISREHLKSYINSTLKNLETCWISIAQSYASIRVYYLSSLRHNKR